MELPVLGGESPVCRAILNKNWINKRTNQATYAAFLLRPAGRDPDGLSVILDNAQCSPSYCAARMRTCFGEFVLSVRQIMDLGLTVVPDKPNHAAIVGLPVPESDDPAAIAAAERLATKLAERAKIRLRG